MTYYIRNAWETPDGTIIESKHRWDYQSHEDAATGEVYMCDGLGLYIRRSVNVIPAKSLCVTTEDAFELQRKYFRWKSFYDADQNLLEVPKVIFLCDMQTEHILAILQTQKHIVGTAVETIFKKEIEYRKAMVE